MRLSHDVGDDPGTVEMKPRGRSTRWIAQSIPLIRNHTNTVEVTIKLTPPKMSASP